jgi:hypothetical protein
MSECDYELRHKVVERKETESSWDAEANVKRIIPIP